MNILEFLANKEAQKYESPYNEIIRSSFTLGYNNAILELSNAARKDNIKADDVLHILEYMKRNISNENS